ncbi:ABC transporter ATP-binding protein [Acidocella facilis]|uniref:ABC transporter ATP-binding protein n=1 Tax=Acidocella facilis TaxID=525 RepID=UPI00047A2857|nr:sn-glycerol-3-phosphate ABC transporter ATP-binding protein UgpC [Acidocella facilis]
MASVRLQGLRKRFGTHDVIPSLDLEINDHEFMVFVGPSGCGKSTLLRIIAGLEPITEGDLFIGDRRVNDLTPAQRDIAMVFQDYALYPHMTVYQNMAFGLEMRHAAKADIETRVLAAARMLEIEPLLKRRPRDLSGGQRQRVAMGRAVVRDPQVFLFDEPLSNLDAQLRGQVRGEIKALSQRLQTTMVFVTHDQVEAMTMADRIVVLRGGVIQQVGTPEQIYSTPANRFVAGFIGSPSMNFLPVTLEAGGARLEDGTLLPVLTTRRGPAVLGIRPEHFEPAGEGGLAAQILLVEPLGADTLVHFNVGAVRCIARVAPDTRPQMGETLRLGVAPGKAFLFDPESGVRLG